MFKEYVMKDSAPVVVKAIQITPEFFSYDSISKLPSLGIDGYICTNSSVKTFELVIENKIVEVFIGDYIVRDNSMKLHIIPKDLFEEIYESPNKLLTGIQ